MLVVQPDRHILLRFHFPSLMGSGTFCGTWRAACKTRLVPLSSLLHFLVPFTTICAHCGLPVPPGFLSGAAWDCCLACAARQVPVSNCYFLLRATWTIPPGVCLFATNLSLFVGMGGGTFATLNGIPLAR